MRFLIIFIFLITNVVAEELPGIKNIVIHKIPKTYDNVIFLDKNDQKININEYKGNFLILNFWAVWCEPCKEEMPSLDRLQQKYDKQDFQILAISVDRGPKKKSVNFFNEYEIQNIDLFFDDKNNIPREVRAAGLPFSFFIDQEGNQIAKFIGPTEWDSNYFQDYIDSNL